VSKQRQLLKLSSTLVFYWEKGKLVCEDYFSHVKINPSLPVIGLLDRFGGQWQEKDASGNNIFRVQEERAIKQLKRLGLLFKKNSSQDLKRRNLESWKWGVPAKYSVFSIRHANKLTSAKKRAAYARRLLKESPQPPLYKTYTNAPILVMEKPGNTESPPFQNLLSVRNTEKFLHKPIALSVLSRILYAVWGEQEKIDTPLYGKLPVKTSRSAGNRYPVEVYPIVANVQGIRPGLYHYNCRDHVLERLKSGNLEKNIFEIACHQQPFKNAAVYFLMTAVLERTAWKYRHDQGLLMIGLDAGHLSQSLYIAAAACGLGVYTTATILRPQIEKLLRIDPTQEIALTLSSSGFHQ
jgi:SagB-type dehydrogenase family enzyme